jgi:hypothetical protein
MRRRDVPVRQAKPPPQRFIFLHIPNVSHIELSSRLNAVSISPGGPSGCARLHQSSAAMGRPPATTKCASAIRLISIPVATRLPGMRALTISTTSRSVRRPNSWDRFLPGRRRSQSTPFGICRQRHRCLFLSCAGELRILSINICASERMCVRGVNVHPRFPAPPNGSPVCTVLRFRVDGGTPCDLWQGREQSSLIVPKIVIDMSRFPSGRHLISWPGIRPRKGESFKTTLMRRA